MSVFLALVGDNMHRILPGSFPVVAVLSTTATSARLVQDAPAWLRALVAWLDDERTAWAATVRIREAASVPASPRFTSGRWSRRDHIAGFVAE